MDQPPRMPARVGRYQLLGPLGAGGMASVQLALVRGAAGFSREVAIKLLHAHLVNDKDLVEQFLNEGRVAARIRHPNVVPVIDVAEEHGVVYLVMEFVEGDSLSGLRRAAKHVGQEVPQRVWLSFLCDALAGLHAAHEVEGDDGVPLGLVHRDFSPQNILVGLDGVARLSDFGIAKLSASGSNTVSGVVKGKVQYMSPEQVAAKPLDRRCDVWAAGVLCWELAVGRRLRKRRDAEIQTLLEIMNIEPPRVSSVRPGFPAALSEAIASALTLKLDQRCPTAAELRKRLLAAAEGAGGVADHEECAVWVRQMSLERIRERRRKLQEAKQLREKLDELIEPGAESQSSSLSAQAVSASPAGSESLDSAQVEQTAETRSTLSRDSGQTRSPRGIRVVLALIVVGLVGTTAYLMAGSSRSVTPLRSVQGLASRAKQAALRARPPPPAPRPTLKVSANETIAELWIDGRKLDITKPARELVLDLPKWAVGREELKLDAVAESGAKTSLLVRDGQPVTLKFEARPPVVRATGPAQAKKPSGKKPLAGNPYGN